MFFQTFQRSFLQIKSFHVSRAFSRLKNSPTECSGIGGNISYHIGFW